MAEFREYLVMLNSDPSDARALAELQKLGGTIIGSPEASSALDEARQHLNPDEFRWYTERRASLEKIEVEIRTLDEFDLTPDILKVDVEGAEVGVVKGLPFRINSADTFQWDEQSSWPGSHIEFLSNDLPKLCRFFRCSAHQRDIGIMFIKIASLKFFRDCIDCVDGCGVDMLVLHRWYLLRWFPLRRDDLTGHGPGRTRPRDPAARSGPC